MVLGRGSGTFFWRRLMDDRFEAVSFENKGDLVYAQLSHALMQGQLRPQERLKIRELAARMGTSVTPVRDAILRLVQEGALVLISPRDIRVRSLTLPEYLEIRNIRVELEGMAAAAAVGRAQAQDVEHLQQLVEQNELAMQEGRFSQAIGLNQAFHFEFCRIADMPLLGDILRRLWLKMGPLIAQQYEEGGRAMIDYHYPVLEAFRQGDAQAARAAIQADILSGGHAILTAKTQAQGRRPKASALGAQ